ncbi:MAG: hypothetical protein ACRD6W_17225, partial [Nitrososphaerales archaeon]
MDILPTHEKGPKESDLGFAWRISINCGGVVACGLDEESRLPWRDRLVTGAHAKEAAKPVVFCTK